MARLQRLGVPETKAVMDLCSWKVDDFKIMQKVLKKFECYETKDIVEKTRSTVHVSKVKMSRGEVLTMPSKLLVRLSKMNPEYFLNIADSILTSKVSLKQAVEEYDKDKGRIEVTNIIKRISKKDMKVLEEEHKGCFNMEVIDSFLGATADNDKGVHLKKYVEQVMSGKKGQNKVIKLGHVVDVRKIAAESETLVANLAEPKHNDQKTDFLDAVCKEDKSTILVFTSEKEQLDALAYLRSQNDVPVKQLLFDKNTDDSAGCYSENLHFGLISGKLEAVQGKIKVYNGKLDQLKSVVGQITAPGAKVSSIADEDKDLLIVHSETLIGSTTYFGTDSQLKEVHEIAVKEGYTTEKICDVENNEVEAVDKEKEDEITTTEKICDVENNDVEAVDEKEDENTEVYDPFNTNLIEEFDSEELGEQYASNRSKNITMEVPGTATGTIISLESGSSDVSSLSVAQQGRFARMEY